MNVPQDRKIDYNPKIVPKYWRDISKIDGKIIRMYARVMTTRQISEQIMGIYGFEVSEAIVTSVTNKILPQIEERSAYSLELKHPDTITTLIGHTRNATHGSADKNFNNHPIFGKAGTTCFALAHNGVLWNDRASLHLPKTKIETDSYIAVQLIEQQKS